MEPCETKNSFSELSGLFAGSECLTLVVEQAKHVGFDSSGGLLGNLDRSLKQRDGEILVGGGTQEKSEVAVQLAPIELVKDVLQFWQKTDGQMAVTEEAPLTLFCALVEDRDGFL